MGEQHLSNVLVDGWHCTATSFLDCKCKVVSFNTAISACSKAACWEWGLAVLMSMTQ